MKMKIDTVVVGELQTNCYILSDPKSGEAVVIDPGANASKILGRISGKNIKVKYVIHTHGHPDHFGATKEICESTGAESAVHELDAPVFESKILTIRGFLLPAVHVDKKLRDGDVLKFGSDDLSVIHTPGHSRGGISLYSGKDGVVFTGDTLFCHDVGRTDLPGGDKAEMRASLKKLTSLPENIKVFPGHGPPTTISQEKINLGAQL